MQKEGTVAVEMPSDSLNLGGRTWHYFRLLARREPDPFARVQGGSEAELPTKKGTVRSPELPQRCRA
jgi:hypothetical protein